MNPLNQNDTAVQNFFQMMEDMPSTTYYGLMLGSIVASLYFFLTGRRHTALFIGQWAPTILLSALFYKLLRPSNSNTAAGTMHAMRDFTH